MSQGFLFSKSVMVASASKVGVYYQVDLEKKTCTCPQFTYRHKPCSHLRELGVPDVKEAPVSIGKNTTNNMMEYDALMLTRLSPHYILRDFMFSSQAEILGMPNRPSDDVDQVIASGKRLCQEVLEPLIEQFGPLNITFGYQSRELIEIGGVSKPTSSNPHQWDRKTFGNEIYARIDILPYCVETGTVSKHDYAKWMMYNLDIDLLMQWKKSNVFCVTIGPKPRRLWLEWVPKGEGQNGSNRIDFMGSEYWTNFNEYTEPKPKFFPSETNGHISWNYK